MKLELFPTFLSLKQVQGPFYIFIFKFNQTKSIQRLKIPLTTAFKIAVFDQVTFQQSSLISIIKLAWRMLSVCGICYALSAANLYCVLSNFRFFDMTVTELMSSKYRNFLKAIATLAKLSN